MDHDEHRGVKNVRNSVPAGSETKEIQTIYKPHQDLLLAFVAPAAWANGSG